MTFQKKLDSAVKQNNSLLCIGLDSDIEKIPLNLKKEKYPLFVFNKKIIDTTHDLVCAYKPNSAFYEALGDKGIKQLKMTCDYLHKNIPEIPIILDFKRGDIGNTNNAYRKFAYDYLGVDAVTLQCYLGKEAILPFLEVKNKGVFILCRTSNPGAGEFQDLLIKGKPLYKLITENIVKKWNYNNNCMIVAGATYPKELAQIRVIIGNMTVLVPGVGSQGGDLEKTLKYGLNTDKKGLIINSSRGIIFASTKNDFDESARLEAEKLRNEINKFRN